MLRQPDKFTETIAKAAEGASLSVADTVEAMRRRGLFGAAMATAFGAGTAGMRRPPTREPGRMGQSDVLDRYPKIMRVARPSPESADRT